MRPVAQRFGHQELERLKWRTKARIAGLAISAAVVTLIALPPAQLFHIFKEQAPAALEAVKSHSLMALLAGLAAALIVYGFWGRAGAGAAPASRAAPPPSLRVRRARAAQGGKLLKRPSFLPERHTDEAGQEVIIPNRTGPSAQSAAGFLMRFRHSLALGENETEAVTQPRPVRKLVRHPRFRLPPETARSSVSGAAPKSNGQDPAALKPNDLRHYLTQKLASDDKTDSSKAHRLVREPKGDQADPVLKSLDAVLSQVFAAIRSAAPRALLIGSGCARVDATAEALSIARSLVAGGDQVVLVDLACGQASISRALGLSPSPGLAELSAGRARFEDVIRIDAETPLQLITAGHPELAAEGSERFRSVFEALTQAYEGVVLHADHEAVLKLTSALRVELPVAVAVVESRTGGAKVDLSAFSLLGCPVLVYEQEGDERRSSSLAAPVSQAAASSE